ncbi:hypothetical protein [Phormidium sp. CCY1219]|uniref:hypothetical protein n=1 Tax=Phormidium sp. CCY1219 TaxID=2886104 RepID=UPI002D1F0444|nr:hypothetical protein [Phormidium sp. CCY1219]MEB3831408.1 hypothetical protein [Phormidium sp. CCY1219]
MVVGKIIPDRAALMGWVLMRKSKVGLKIDNRVTVRSPHPRSQPPRAPAQRS